MKHSARRLAFAALLILSTLSTLVACTPGSTPGAGGSSNPGTAPSTAPSTGGGIGY
jgi:hypothetical protein